MIIHTHHFLYQGFLGLGESFEFGVCGAVMALIITSGRDEFSPKVRWLMVGPAAYRRATSFIVGLPFTAVNVS